MIHLPASVRVFLCLTPCDMRKSFDSLQALVREHLDLDAFAGHLFVFASRRKDRVKILYWDRDGFAIWRNGWRRGRTQFRLATAAQNVRREITAEELVRSAAERHRSEYSETAGTVQAREPIKHSCLMSFSIGNGSVSAYAECTVPIDPNSLPRLTNFGDPLYRFGCRRGARYPIVQTSRSDKQQCKM